MSERHIDWQAIRADYESGVSLRQLASIYGVSKSAIGERKFKEKWTERTTKRPDTANSGSNTTNLNAAVQVEMAIKIFLEERPSWDEVASRAGYASRGAAYNAVKREMNRRITHDVEELRTQELYRIEQLMARCYKEGTDKNNKYFNYAIEQFGKLSKRKSELLGLDKRPEEELLNQNYTKRIVLVPGGENNATGS
jgi:AraC-like DNA-binding protein